jgi:hypothetical protein
MRSIQERNTCNYKLFIINGHGSSIPINHEIPYYGLIPSSITLQPNQYVIMYNLMDGLRGSSWLQDELWEKIVYSKSPLEFINNIQKTTKKGGLSNHLFGYYGSDTHEIECPNLSIDLTLDHYSEPYLDRFGIFSAPISVNESNKAILYNYNEKKNKSYSNRYLISKIPNPQMGNRSLHMDNNRSLHMDNNRSLQFNLLNYTTSVNNPYNVEEEIPIPYYRIYSQFATPFNFLHEFVFSISSQPFIIFCNICRSCDTSGYVEYPIYPDILPLDQLVNIFTQKIPTPLNPRALSFKPHSLSVVDPSLTDVDPSLSVVDPSLIEVDPSLTDVDPSEYIYSSSLKKYLKYKNKYIKLKKLLFI